MKKTFTAVIVALLCVTHNQSNGIEPTAGIDIDTKVAQTLKSYTPPEFDAKKESLDGQIIKIKFTSRQTDITEGEGDLLSGGIRGEGSRSSKTSGGSSYLTVEFPKDQKAWFAKISTAYDARVALTAIGKVKKGKYGSYVVELIGREIKTDMKGSKIVW